jgi:hypothetical protein
MSHPALPVQATLPAESRFVFPDGGDPFSATSGVRGAGRAQAVDAARPLSASPAVAALLAAAGTPLARAARPPSAGAFGGSAMTGRLPTPSAALSSGLPHSTFAQAGQAVVSGTPGFAPLPAAQPPASSTIIQITKASGPATGALVDLPVAPSVGAGQSSLGQPSQPQQHQRGQAAGGSVDYADDFELEDGDLEVKSVDLRQPQGVFARTPAPSRDNR